MRILSIAAIAAAALTLGFTLAGHVSAARQAVGLIPIRDRALAFSGAQSESAHPLYETDSSGTYPVYTGTFAVNFTVTLKTAVPTGDVVECEVTLKPEYQNSTGSVTYTDSAFAQATLTGSKLANCTVKVPYAWKFPQAGGEDEEFVYGTYSVAICNPSVLNPTTNPLDSPEASPAATTTPMFPLVHATTNQFLAVEKTGASVFTNLPLTYAVAVTL
jgi:hypothetical protein